MIEVELAAHCLDNKDTSDWLTAISLGDGADDIFGSVAALPKADVRRLAAFSPMQLNRILNSRSSMHLKIASSVGVLLDMALIQRSTTGSLPQKDGPPIPLKDLFKKINKKTTIIEQTPGKKIEYQY